MINHEPDWRARVRALIEQWRAATNAQRHADPLAGFPVAYFDDLLDELDALVQAIPERSGCGEPGHPLTCNCYPRATPAHLFVDDGTGAVCKTCGGWPDDPSHRATPDREDV